MLLFAWQAFVPLAPARVTLARVADLVRTSPDRIPPSRKPELYTAICGELLGATDLFHFGYWEFTADTADAEDEYQAWCEGTLVDADEEEGDPDGEAYGFVTLLFLFEEGGRADAQLWELVESVPEGDEWTRESFVRFLESFPMLDFASIRSTVVFVRPGNAGHGVMAATMREEHYHHLSPIL